MKMEQREKISRFRSWVWDLMCYGGLTKEEYQSSIRDITRKNQETLVLGSAMVALLFLGLFCGSLVSANMADARLMYGLMLVVSAVIFALSKTVTPRRPGLVLPLWYLLFLAFSAYGVMLNTFLRPTLSATTICAFLLAGPLLIIDRPLRMIAYTLTVAVVFIFCALSAKTPYLAFADSVNVICCVFLGAAIYTRLNRVKLREMCHARQVQRERDTDRLTMLCNKSAFMDRIQAALSRKTTGALLVMDVDNFKQINDSYGHDFGDVILQRTARCIQETFQPAGLCARFGGDEYVVFLPGIDKDALTEALDRLMARIKADVVLPDAGKTLGISVGVAFFPRDGQDYGALFRSADNALYAAKKLGKNRYLIYGE